MSFELLSSEYSDGERKQKFLGKMWKNFSQFVYKSYKNILAGSKKVSNYLQFKRNSAQQKGSESLAIITRYGADLTKLALEGKLEECYGRDKELQALMEILARRHKNNAVLIGQAGVGKTAIVELFATTIVRNLVPFIFQGKKIINIDLAKIVAGARHQGDFEKRFQELIEALQVRPDIIIFIDEIHNLTKIGKAEGSIDAANLLKPALSRSGLQCIGATTIQEYEDIQKDPALDRRFQPIYVKEPTIQETIAIISHLQPVFESFHNIKILPEAISEAVNLSARYVQDRFFPDKAIDLIDRVGAQKVIERTSHINKSPVEAYISSILRTVEQLRFAAFRSGNVSAEYIFSEILNIYNSYFLKWLKNPFLIPKKEVPGKNLLETNLIKSIRESFLQHVEGLIQEIEFKNKLCINITNYSPNVTNKLLKIKYSKNILNFTSFYYKVASYLSKIWLLSKPKYSIYPCFFRLRNSYSGLILASVNRWTILSTIENQSETLIILNLWTKLQPILTKGIVETLSTNPKLILSKSDKKKIYNILGYFNEYEKESLIYDLQNSQNVSTIIPSNLVTKENIQELLTKLTGIEVTALSVEESTALLNLEKTLHAKIIGQEEAVSAIAKAIRRARLGLQNRNRPLASFMFCGPTGVGKTQVTKALAFTLFKSEKSMIRFDMSEFMEKFSISRLIGAPPGYIGYGDGGELTKGVREKPYSIILFDELEKGHPDILNILLQILEDGRLTDSQKRVTHFENTVIIMTSNTASEEIQKAFQKEQKLPLLSNNEDKEGYSNNSVDFIPFLTSPIHNTFHEDMKNYLTTILHGSFRNAKNSQKKKNSSLDKRFIPKLKQIVMNRLKEIFLPEFLNRLDDVIIFQPLNVEELRRICDLIINDFSDQILASNNITLIVENDVKIRITKEGYQPSFGARPVRRLITKYIEDLVSDYLLHQTQKRTSIFLTIFINKSGQIAIKEKLEDSTGLKSFTKNII